MPGIRFKYENRQNEIFYSIDSMNYQCIGQIFVEFEFIHKKSLKPDTASFILTSDQKEFLENGIGKLTDSFVEKYLDNETKGLNSKTIFFKDKEYKLFINASKIHKTILNLIQLYNFMDKSIKENINLIFEGENE